MLEWSLHSLLGEPRIEGIVVVLAAGALIAAAVPFGRRAPTRTTAELAHVPA